MPADAPDPARGASCWRARRDAPSRELLAHQDFPVDDCRRELGLTEPTFETVFDADRRRPTSPDDAVLRRRRRRARRPLALRLRYRTDALDAGYAARIARLPPRGAAR